MFGEFLLLEKPGATAKRATRLPLGNTAGRSEAWLRDTLFDHPELLPVADLDASYGPLLPLCKELRTPAGPIDIAFINAHGQLTLVECKLWRNPESRRKVVAQILDYARTLKEWSYADLQRQVAMASGRGGDTPYEIVRSSHPELEEHHFIDSVTRSLKNGRFLLLVAGDGIREDIHGIADLINRNATSGFSFGQVEVALYEFPDGALALQPRVIARTELIERHVIVTSGGFELAETEAPADADIPASVDPAVVAANAEIREREMTWWLPVTTMRFDDPEQDPPAYRWRNHVRAAMPIPGVWLTAYVDADGKIGVFLAGSKSAVARAMEYLPEHELLAELPEGSYIRAGRSGGRFYGIKRQVTEFADDAARHEWLRATVNSFVNAIRPRLSHAKV